MKRKDKTPAAVRCARKMPYVQRRAISWLAYQERRGGHAGTDYMECTLLTAAALVDMGVIEREPGAPWNYVLTAFGKEVWQAVTEEAHDLCERAGLTVIT